MTIWRHRILGWTVVAAFSLTAQGAVAVPAAPARIVEVRLTDGSILKGEVTARSAEDITLRTEYGVVRVPAERLSPASRTALFAPRDLGACEARLTDLGARLAALEHENQELRRRLAAQQEAAPLMSQPSADTMRASPPSDAALRYSRSSTGKRHNSGCRYYEADKLCARTAGAACKIRGG